MILAEGLLAQIIFASEGGRGGVSYHKQDYLTFFILCCWNYNEGSENI